MKNSRPCPAPSVERVTGESAQVRIPERLAQTHTLYTDTQHLEGYLNVPSALLLQKGLEKNGQNQFVKMASKIQGVRKFLAEHLARLGMNDADIGDKVTQIVSAHEHEVFLLDRYQAQVVSLANKTTVETEGIRLLLLGMCRVIQERIQKIHPEHLAK